MSASLPGAIKAEPNLTPLLDLVFQLITFFMLLVNFGKDDYNARVRLPVADSARPAEAATEMDRVMVHVDRDGMVLVKDDKGKDEPYGMERARTYLSKQVQLLRLYARGPDGKPLPPNAKLTATLVLRVDRDARFERVEQIMKMCQGLGFQAFALKVLSGS